jgi:capsular polysaccharide biosynthesis protein
VSLSGARAKVAAEDAADRQKNDRNRAPALLRFYKSLLPRGRDRTVLLLADDAASDEVMSHLEHFTGDRIHVIATDILPEWQGHDWPATFHQADDIDGINWVAKAVGPLDIIVVLSRHDDTTHAALWERLFLHLRPGGAYAALRSAIDPVGAPDGLLARLRNIAALRDGGDRSQAGALELEFAASSGRLVFARDLVIVSKNTQHYLKMRESDTNELLPGRRSGIELRVLASLPGGQLTTAGTVVSHPSSVPIHAVDTTLSYPALHLREYTGKIGFVANGLLFAEHTALPDSFRHHLDANPRNRRTKSITKEFLRIDHSLMPTETLPGSYYHLDSENSGHFGHLMTEVVGRLWGWEQAKAEIPDLKAIFRIRYPDERDPVLERRIFTAYGIPEDDIVWVDHPMWLEHVVAATPMWHNHRPHYVHPQIARTWDTLLSGMKPDPRTGPEKVFVSRRSAAKNRNCRNAADVEAVFAAHGFSIVQPEQLDLSDQAGLFRDAVVVAGLGGSGLFSTLYGKKLKTLIVCNQEAYTARNEHLFAMVKGCDVHYFWSTPDISHPPGKWSEEAYYSAWEFDFDRNGAELEAVLRGLG